ncbi:hypothetical protein [Streptosporangium roseum]|uniref:Uncharacterized protein n=1 Tax=Streptosporangium roseum (strain ATCC 12428 / DSM 43021 / JCM 3005 / KCTC 9067 / NCIMB 10171 / NRRL 2505 / NI 9100) TaxID=479432 RepID=D2BBG4_STRRD|nr:hypothetical protein [Streptosporangium roseum]ACZ84187.1 hypothetical protein Sros_1189 [Streptosporangium roseum DSM 43021]
MEGVSSVRRRLFEPDISGLICESFAECLWDARSVPQRLRVVQSFAEWLRVAQPVTQ